MVITRIFVLAGLLFSQGSRAWRHSHQAANPLSSRILLPRHLISTTNKFGYVNPSARSVYSSSSISLTSNTDEVDDKIDLAFMKLALRHAQHAFREKEVPIGAVVVDGEGKVLSASRNRVEALKDASAHAEILALRRAATVQGNWRLLNCTLYTTLEPCAMCMGAAQSFRVKRVVFGAKDHRLGACGSWINLIESLHPFQTVDIKGGILQDESSNLMKRFFHQRRRENLNGKQEHAQEGLINGLEEEGSEGELESGDAGASLFPMGDLQGEWESRGSSYNVIVK